jgi:hypothetical protein
MFRLIIPLIVGHQLVAKCPPASKTQEPVQNSVRRLMWPILLIAMGFSWYLASPKGGLRADGAYTVLLALVMWWMHTQFCRDDPAQAKLILVLVAAATGLVTYIAGTSNVTASMMLLPMLVWVLFAERLQFPKLRIRLPSINIKLPSVNIAQNGGPIVSVKGPAPAPTSEKPTQTSDGVPKASTSAPVPPTAPTAPTAIVADVIATKYATQSAT